MGTILNENIDPKVSHRTVQQLKLLPGKDVKSHFRSPRVNMTSHF